MSLAGWSEEWQDGVSTAAGILGCRDLWMLGVYGSWEAGMQMFWDALSKVAGILGCRCLGML